jgi:hypothetical protein
MKLDPLAKDILAAGYVRQVTTGDRLDWREWARSTGHSEDDARRACVELNDRYLIECCCGCLKLRPTGIRLVEEEGIGSEGQADPSPGAPLSNDPPNGLPLPR